MFFKQEFIGSGFHDLFLQVGSYDEEELRTSDLHDVENISIELDALHCLRFFPRAENLILRPGRMNPNDTHYLYDLPVKFLKLDYYSDTWDEYTIDLGAFQQLNFVFSRTQCNFKNVRNAQSLKTLVVQEWHECNLLSLTASGIARLELMQGRLDSLIGIESLPGLIELSLSNQRLLRDLSPLGNCKRLELLEIDSCNKADLETIPSHPSIKSLRLVGRQKIASQSYFLRFPSLEKLILGIKIMDGDISSFLRLRHCVILTDYKHYNYRNSELPKLH